MSSCTPPSRAMRNASSIASNSESLSERMCVMYAPWYGAIAFAISISSGVRA